MFKVGDHVRLVKENATLRYMGMGIGDEFVLIDSIQNHKAVAYFNDNAWVAILDPDGKETQYANYFEHVEKTEWKSWPNGLAVNPKETEKPCTCESLVLFRKGCQCGAVKKQQWGLRA